MSGQSAGPQPPHEAVDDQTRRLRDSVEERVDDYLELMRNSARAWDRKEFDSKRLIEESTALFEYVTRDVMWWFRHAVQSAQPSPAATSSSALSINVPITPPKDQIMVACSGLVHVQHTDQTIAQNAIAVSPNPVVPGTTSVEVSFDPFGKRAGAYVGKLVQWRSTAPKPIPLGDVIFYVGGNNQRF